MRAVALSDKAVQKKIADSFIPLKIEIPIGTEAFPLDWAGLEMWRKTYKRMGGPKVDGITACSVISPDLQTELGSTGSALVWELFDSIAYDAEKFAAMLDRAAERAERLEKITNNKALEEKHRERQLAVFRRQTRRDVGKEGRFRLPPKGFSVEGAKELFRMTGDLVDGK